MYCTARSNYAIPCKLEEQALRHARSFYDAIGYNGVFALAVDATAVVPTMRVKGNKIIGLATEHDVMVNSAQDILNVVKNREYKLANQANTFILGGSFENEDRSTKHPNLENDAPKTRKRSTLGQKRRPLNLENKAPKIRKRSIQKLNTGLSFINTRPMLIQQESSMITL